MASTNPREDIKVESSKGPTASQASPSLGCSRQEVGTGRVPTSDGVLLQIPTLLCSFAQKCGGNRQL
jgi:hypothetical protein